MGSLVRVLCQTPNPKFAIVSDAIIATLLGSTQPIHLNTKIL
jgi:hypothetical protein